MNNSENLADAILNITKNNSNFIIGNDSIAQLAAGAAGGLMANYVGENPVSYLANVQSGTIYSTTPFKNLYRLPGQFSDFRARLGNTEAQSRLKARKDGTYAATNLSAKSLAYALASTTVGAYTVFNLNAGGKRGYGWGEHGNGGIYTSDFTIQSLVATKWSSEGGIGGSWKPKYKNLLTPFRGDRVNAIDYSKRKLKDAYIWKPSLFKKLDNLTALGALNPNITQDFIKFFFTGPSLHNGNDSSEDDIMVFRATITTLDDSFSAGWTATPMIGRADPNYIYSSFSRDMSLSFTVLATDRDELKPIWRKLNALAGYTAPTYDKNTIGLVGPWMRVTIGDLLVQQPILLESVGFTLMDSDTTWEINIENDPEMKQVPHKIGVTLRFKVITDYLPQKNGQFYTLAAINNEYGSAMHTTSWLTDSTNPEVIRRTETESATGILPSTTNISMDLIKLGLQ